MGWTNPRTWNIGELVTKAMLDEQLRDNLIYLKAAVAAIVSKRQGGSASDWNVAGTTGYTPSATLIQVGVVEVVLSGSAGNYYGSTTVTFPTAFSQKPVVFVSDESGADNQHVSTTANAAASVHIEGWADQPITLTVAWIAIGPP